MTQSKTQLNPTGSYAMYLRKSRADLEAERQGDFETLTKHHQILTELAERHQIKVSKVYKELVSGETIADRPQIQSLLEEVRAGLYDGVLVTEISRLARGNTRDQGEVSEAFLAANTLIITPTKIYDPSDDQDETFFDFELFLARQEFKYIKKRLKAGKLASMRAGNWLQAFAPTGYTKEGKTLIPNEYAPVVKELILAYADGAMGISDGVRFLRSHGLEKASTYTVRYILSNYSYAGLLQLGVNPLVTVTGKDGKIRTYRKHRKTGEVVQGNWEPLVSKEIIDKCRANLQAAPRYKVGAVPRNIFAGLLVCEKCGKTLYRAGSYGKHKRQPTLVHQHSVNWDKCNCARAMYDDIVKDIQKALADTLPDLSATHTAPKRGKTSTQALEAKLSKAKTARAGLYDKLDMGIYTPAEYKERADKWDKEIATLEQSIKDIMESNRYTMTAKERRATTKDLIRLMDNPDDDVELINRTLKMIVDKITYWRESSKEDYRLTIYFRD